MYRGANVVGELIEVRKLIGGVQTQTASCAARGKGGIREDDYWRTSSDSPGGLTPREALQNGAHLRRGPQAIAPGDQDGVQKAGAGYKDGSSSAGFLQLAKAFITQEEECFVFDDRAADGHPVLPEAKRRNGLRIGKIARIENRIA